MKCECEWNSISLLTVDEIVGCSDVPLKAGQLCLMKNWHIASDSLEKSWFSLDKYPIARH